MIAKIIQKYCRVHQKKVEISMFSLFVLFCLIALLHVLTNIAQ